MGKVHDGELAMMKRMSEHRETRLSQLTEKEMSGVPLSAEETSELQTMREQDRGAEGKPDQLGSFGTRI